MGGRLYVVGGFAVGNASSSVERYDEEKDQWEAVADMGTARSFVGVAASSLVVDLPHTGADVAPRFLWMTTKTRFLIFRFKFIDRFNSKLIIAMLAKFGCFYRNNAGA